MVEFFLGANTPEGFHSLFSELYDANDGWNAYIIKGGPGTGKSGLMKNLAAAADQAGLSAERVICSSDPDSIDAVIIPQLRVSIADGTAPHVIEPQYPGAVEQLVNLGEYWNTAAMRENAEKIIELTKMNKLLHRRCTGFIAAAGSLLADSRRLACSCVIKEKAERYALRFVSRELGTLNGTGKEYKRFLSAVTPKGYYTNTQTVPELSDRIFMLCDEFGGVSSVLMPLIKKYALANGHKVISCLNPFDPNGAPEQLIFPEKRVAVLTSNRLHPFKEISARNIHSKRFTDTEELAKKKHRLSFNSKAFSELLGEAVSLLQGAKATHDRLEALYISEMSFEGVNQKCESLKNEIFGEYEKTQTPE